MEKKDVKLRAEVNEPKLREEAKKSQDVAKETNANKDAAEASLPERFTISSRLLNDMIGILSILPAYQIMELITKVQMDLTLSPTKEELDSYFKAKREAANKEPQQSNVENQTPINKG